MKNIKDTFKALFTLMVPVFATIMIFNVTIMNAYINAKKLESLNNVKRAPAVAVVHYTDKR
jgi:hypothetical protein